MKPASLLPICGVTMLLCVSADLRAQNATDGELAAAGFLVGTWQCSHTVGDFAGTYTTTISNTLENRWFRQTYLFPASANRPEVRAEYFIGYDPRNQRWLRFGAMSDGMYFAMTAKRNGDVWAWSYVLPGSSATAAVYTRRSDTEFTVDGPTYPENGRPVTEHHRCLKAT